MRRKKLGSKGFTLMEVLIVLVILGVLAGLAIPAYQSNVNRSRSAEAMATLAATRQSLIRYYMDQGNNTYTGATTLNIDFNPNSTTGGQVQHFDYSLTIGAQTFTITATPKATFGSGTATVDHAGNRTNTIQ